jgi:hypothetical protein
MEQVYFVEAEGLGLIKIGRSRTMWMRMAKWYTDCPVPVKILGLMPGDHDVELWMHVKFAEYRVRGEWFRDCSDIRKWIEEKTAI